jgi:Fe/S biogenesis protein NfuA
MSIASDSAVVTVTDKARRAIVEMREDRDPADSEGDAFWIEVLGERAGEYAYDLYFQGVRHADGDDAVMAHDDLTVIVPAASIGALQGATLDLSRDLLEPGLALDNPNQPTPPASPSIDDGDVELSGPIEERVQQVLDQRINPSIAGHGGRADLVGVEDGRVSLRLSGGCQGCGMAAATLRNGIEVRLREAIPEITEIIDVTDHDSGADPYY